MPPAQERHEQPRELLSLPDDVLVRCLEPLSQEERFRDVALVCKRLRALCRAPELLRQVTVTLRDAPGLPHQARLVSLRGFLEAAGQHIGGLRLDVPSDIGLADDATVCVEAWSEVGAPCLRDLSVTAPLTGRTDWLLAMTGLTRLELRCHSDTLHLPRGFSQLTALASAGLWGAPFVLDVPLPRGLTALSFLTNLALPNQLSELTQLADLRVYGHTHEPEPKLDALTALRFLHFSMVYTLPASLALLTGLQALSITTGRFGPEQLVGLTEPQVDAMLQRLPHLTCLAFLDETGVLQRLPPSLAGLQHLRRLCFWLQADAITDASLPQGPWLQSIRWLGVPIKCLLAEGTLAELSAAGELEFLCSLGVPALTSLGMQVPEDFWARWDVLWSWLAAHPPLRCFGFEPAQEATMVDTELLDSVLRLKHRRPGLLVRHVPYGNYEFSNELMDAPDIPPRPTAWS